MLFFISQDIIRAIGGLENYNDGYCNYFDIPAGITVYINFSPADNSFSYINVNWSIQPMRINNPTFKKSRFSNSSK